MSYNNPSGEATYTYTNSGTLILDPATSGLIASSATAGSQYYAQNLTIPTGGAVVSGATIDDKGKLYTNQTVYNITVLSGGTLQRGGGGIGANNITVMSGGTMLSWNGGQAYWAGTWNIQSGANIFGYTDVYTDADGYLNYGWHGLTGALNPFIGIRNIDINSYLYVKGGKGVSGAIVSGGATAANNAFLHFSAANLSAYDVHILSGGSFAISAGNAKIWNIKGDDGARMTFQANNSFGGRETEFAAGFWTNVGMADAYAEGGVIHNWTKPSTGAAFYFYDIGIETGDATNQYIYLGTGAYTSNFTITGNSGKTGIVLGQAGVGSAIDTTVTGTAEGITVQSSYFAVFGGTNNNVGEGHILLGGAGAGVPNASLSIIGDKFNGIEVKNYSNNSTYLKYVKLISGLTAVDPIVSSGGSLALESGGSATGAVIHEGGTLQALKGGTVSGATLSSGYLYIMDYNDASETASVGRPAAFANNVDIEGGQMFLRGSNASGANLRLSNGILYMQNAAHASAVTVTGGALSAYYNNVDPKDATTIHINDLTMAGGAADLYNYAQVDGATITAGTVTMQGTARLSGATVTGGSVTMTGGVVSGATLSNTGKLFVSNGASALNVTVNNPATSPLLTVYAGGYASGVTLVGPTGGGAGTNYIYMYGGLIENVIVDSGSLYLANGGLVRNITVRNGATPVLRGETPYCSGATIEGGTLQFQNGGKGQDVVVNGGGLIVINNGYGWNLPSGIHGSGAQVTGIDVVAGTVTASAGAKLYDLRVSAGTVTVASTTSFGTPFVSGATITGGVVNIITGASMNVATVNAGVVSASNATVRNATVNGGVLYALYDAKVYDTVLAGGSFYVYNHGLASGATIDGNGTLRVFKGGTLSGATLNAGYLYIMDNNAASETTSTGRPANVAIDVVQNGGALFFRGSNASGANVRIYDGVAHLQNAAYVSGLELHGGTVNMTVNGGVHPNDQPNTIRLRDAVIDGGTLHVYNHGDVSGITMTGGEIIVENGGVVSMTAETTLNNAQTVTGAHINFVRNKNSATIQGAETNIAASTFYYDGATTANGFSVVNGVVKNLGADGKAYRIGVGSGIVVEDAVVNDSWRISAFGNAVVSGVVISGGPTEAASIVMRDDSVVYDAFLTGINAASGGVINLYENAKASGTVVGRNGKLGIVAATTEIEDTTIMAGGNLTFSASGVGANTGDLLTIDFTGTGGNQSVNINNMAAISDTTKIVLSGWTAGNTYTLTTGAATNKAVQCYDWGLYQDTVQGGTTYTNAFDGISYDFTNGKAIAVTAFEAAAQSEAGSIESGTDINGNGKAAKWTANTTVEAGATIKAATSTITGDAWLEINGTDLGGTTLYGAAEDFAGGAVNIYATNSATIGNLAAGATSGGTVESVKLTVDNATVGLAYAGGFGTVASATETLIGEGAKMTKDFYAGALANYAKTSATTTAGDITLDIAAGEFNGNIYGAASVKAGTITTTANTAALHTVENVTLTISNGTATKGYDSCVFAGGYATGHDTAKLAPVYTVGSVTATIAGGTWTATSGDTTAKGGRGVFGGAFAGDNLGEGGVWAQVGNVDLTISGGTFGNVYGGGWAQKGARSEVGDVSITVTGGTIANVFGGGTHSKSGGTTETGSVNITVAGGNITNAIYAKGQADGDSVAVEEGETVTVTFTGANDYVCDVFGYSYVGGAGNSDALNFADYTGEFSGQIGGFDGITLDGATAMTLTTAAADVANGKWEFDLSDRDEALAGTSLLTWSTADFAGDTVKVAFADAAQAAAGWSIADAAFTGATFDLYIGGSEITSVAYDTAIADGDWAGWKFTSVGGTLKFAKITA